MTGADARPRPRPSPRFLLISGTVAVAMFLVGFGWQFLEARKARAEADGLRTELAFQELATTLASATIQAEHGSYEGALELMSRFFSGLQARMEEAPAEAREDLTAILDRRDGVITSLSRSDEASRTVLARLFVRYQTAFGGPDRGLPLPPPGETPRPAEPGGPTPDSAGSATDSTTRR